MVTLQVIAMIKCIRNKLKNQNGGNRWRLILLRENWYWEMKRYLMSSIPQNVSDGKFIVTQLLQAFVRMVRMRI